MDEILNEIIIDNITVYQALENIFELADDGASPSDIKRYTSKLMGIPYGCISDTERTSKEWGRLNNKLARKHHE